MHYEEQNAVAGLVIMILGLLGACNPYGILDRYLRLQMMTRLRESLGDSTVLVIYRVVAAVSGLFGLGLFVWSVA